MRWARSRSAIGTRSEMGRVAFRLACSMRSSITFGSVLAIFDPPERIRVPSLTARANSRRVWRRPSGVAYQPASAASDLALPVSANLRAILAPLRCIHLVSGHRPKSLPADGKHGDQVAADSGLAERLPAFLAFDGLGGNDDMRTADYLFNLERRDSRCDPRWPRPNRNHRVGPARL